MFRGVATPRGDDADVPRSRDDDERRYDPEAVTAYLTEAGYPPFMQTGHRYGSDGNGYSIYLQDPEQNVIELKSGDSCDSQ